MGVLVIENKMVRWLYVRRQPYWNESSTRFVEEQRDKEKSALKAEKAMPSNQAAFM